MAKRKPQNLMSPHANESMGLHKLSWWQHTKCKQIRQMYLYKLWIRTDMQYISVYVGAFRIYICTTRRACLKSFQELQTQNNNEATATSAPQKLALKWGEIYSMYDNNLQALCEKGQSKRGRQRCAGAWQPQNVTQTKFAKLSKKGQRPRQQLQRPENQKTRDYNII